MTDVRVFHTYTCANCGRYWKSKQLAHESPRESARVKARAHAYTTGHTVTGHKDVEVVFCYRRKARSHGGRS